MVRKASGGPRRGGIGVLEVALPDQRRPPYPAGRPDRTHLQRRHRRSSPATATFCTSSFPANRTSFSFHCASTSRTDGEIANTVLKWLDVHFSPQEVRWVRVEIGAVRVDNKAAVRVVDAHDDVAVAGEVLRPLLSVIAVVWLSVRPKDYW